VINANEPMTITNTILHLSDSTNNPLMWVGDCAALGNTGITKPTIYNAKVISKIVLAVFQADTIFYG
jgi:hypothetical protein